MHKLYYAMHGESSGILSRRDSELAGFLAQLTQSMRMESAVFDRGVSAGH
jgi:hypothetical protein